jgi:hypothetical protein
MALSAWLRVVGEICRRAHFARVPHHPSPALPVNEKAHPMPGGLLHLEAIVQLPGALPKLAQEPGRCERRRAGFLGCFVPVKNYFKRTGP